MSADSTAGMRRLNRNGPQDPSARSWAAGGPASAENSACECNAWRRVRRTTPLRAAAASAQYPPNEYQGTLHMAAMLERPARQRWSTADVDSRHALAHWVDTICKSFLEIDIESPQRHAFRARFDQSSLGPVMMNIVEADAQRIRRTPARIGEVAPRCGFQRPSPFARRSRKAFGLGPMEFRASCRTS
jgi:methylphosphotriester-DNA--protein-cysteine methyltransferase